MSKNLNRASLRKAQTKKEYKLSYQKPRNYCPICAKRAGSLFYSYYDVRLVKARHGSGRPIYSYDKREYKSWKYNRKNQYHEQK